MCIVHRITNGLIISYESFGKNLPSTQELLSSLNPAPFANQMRDVVAQKVPAKKVEISKGRQTRQMSAAIEPIRLNDWYDDGNRSDCWRGRNNRYKKSRHSMKDIW
jgi:hypothetical protein